MLPLHEVRGPIPPPSGSHQSLQATQLVAAVGALAAEPGGHGMHADAGALGTEPGGHGEHCVAAVGALAAEPGGHGVHWASLEGSFAPE